jgi:hypothetical protein
MDEKAAGQLPTIDYLTRVIPQILKKKSVSRFTNTELEIWIIEELQISDDLLSIPREKSRTEFQYRLAWARSKAKIQGHIVNTSPKNWAVANHE